MRCLKETALYSAGWRSGKLGKFTIRNSEDEIVAQVTNNGNVLLKGALYTSVGDEDLLAGTEKFRVGTAEVNLLCIDGDGNLQVKGTLQPHTRSLSTDGACFSLSDEKGNPVLVVNDNLQIHGIVVENYEGAWL